MASASRFCAASAEASSSDRNGVASAAALAASSRAESGAAAPPSEPSSCAESATGSGSPSSSSTRPSSTSAGSPPSTARPAASRVALRRSRMNARVSSSGANWSRSGRSATERRPNFSRNARVVA